MKSIWVIIDIIAFLTFGSFLLIFSKRLARVAVKSSNLLGREFKIKNKLGKSVELMTQIFLIVLGGVFIYTGVFLILKK